MMLPVSVRRTLKVSVSVVLLLTCSSGCIVGVAMEFARRMQAAVDSLPEVNLRIVNHTAVSARVMVDAGITPPDMGPFSDMFVPTDIDIGLAFADSKSVVVAAGGTVNGTIKCGEVIGIAAVTPGDAENFFGPNEMGFGLLTSAGDIRFSGAGSSATDESGFTGDVQTTDLARFIRPSADGLNCSGGTIVIDIQTAGTPGTRDTTTGSFGGGTIGTGTVAIE